MVQENVNISEESVSRPSQSESSQVLQGHSWKTQAMLLYPEGSLWQAKAWESWMMSEASHEPRKLLLLKHLPHRAHFSFSKTANYHILGLSIHLQNHQQHSLKYHNGRSTSHFTQDNPTSPGLTWAHLWGNPRINRTLSRSEIWVRTC